MVLYIIAIYHHIPRYLLHILCEYMRYNLAHYSGRRGKAILNIFLLARVLSIELGKNTGQIVLCNGVFDGVGKSGCHHFFQCCPLVRHITDFVLRTFSVTYFHNFIMAMTITVLILILKLILVIIITKVSKIKVKLLEKIKQDRSRG